jgi:putative ABC transport system permease protein
MTPLALAGRSLLKTPGFTLIAVVTLALGIGLNTAMFSLMNVILLRPLPFEHSAALVRLFRTTPQDHDGSFSPADYLDLKRVEAGFGQFSACTNGKVSLSAPGHPAELQDGGRVSAAYFDVLKVRCELGRNFRPEEEIFGNHRVVILSHALWQNHFSSAPDIIGRIIRIEGEPHEVIGVLPAWANDDKIIRQSGVFRPLSFTDSERVSRGRQWIDIVGRRADTVSVAQGEAFISAFGDRLATDFAKENAGSSWRTVSLLGSNGHQSGRVIIAMLLGLSGFVLLIACSNLANFLLARTIARSHELAVRTALGASRLDLIRPLALESLLLAGAGGTGALFVALWSSDWISAQSVASGDAPMAFPLDWRVLSFAIGTSFLTALVFGIAPALFTTRVDVNHTLKSGARGSTPGRTHQRLRRLLVIGQFAMAMTLLAGVGFFVRGAHNLLNQEFGWNSDQVVEGAFELPVGKYPGSEQILAFHRQLLERLSQLPGAQAVSLSYSLPLAGARQYIVEGRERPAKGQEPWASYNGITPQYFSVTGTRLLGGRTFNATDNATAPSVLIINESMARALFANDNPIGRRVARADAEKPTWAEVVGVVADVRTTGIYEKPVPFQLYHPLVQEPWHSATFAVRTNGLAPESLLEPIRAAFTALDPDLPVRDLMPAGKMVERSSFDLVMLTKMVGAFALLGVALAALGIYGVIARTVAQRAGEIGIRMALGAQVADVIGLVLGSGLRLALIGAAIGLFGAFGLSRLIASIMPAVQTSGGPVLAVATVLLVLIALVACYVPARRAAKIDPLSALRAE